jgi:hypothetical protein
VILAVATAVPEVQQQLRKAAARLTAQRTSAARSAT